MKIIFIFGVFLGMSLFQSNDDLPHKTSTIPLPDTNNSRPELVLQTGHSQAVLSIVFGPDDRWVASGSFDSTIKIWDLSTGQEIRSLIGMVGAVKSIACSSDGKLIAAGGNDSSVRIWDVETGIIVKQFDMPGVVVNALAFSPNGKLLAFNGSDNKIVVRELESTKPDVTFQGHTAAIVTLVFSPNSKLLASGSSDKTAKIWDLGTGKQLQNMEHPDGVTTLRFSDGGTVLASGGLDKTVRIWKAANGKALKNFPGHLSTIRALSFLTEEKLQSADSAGNIKTWDTLAKGDLANNISTSDNKYLDSQAGAFSRDGSIFAISNGDGSVNIVKAKTGEKLAFLEKRTAGLNGIAFSPNQRWMAAASFDSVKLWDLTTGENLPLPQTQSGRVNCVAFFPDNKRMVSGSLDNSITIWDTISLKPLKRLQGHEEKDVSNAINSVAINSNGRFIVSGNHDGTIGIWDMESNEPARFPPIHTGDISSVAISPKSDLVVSGSVDSLIKITDIVTGSVVLTIPTKTGEIDAVAFSPDGKFIASGGADSIIRIWDAETGSLIRPIPGHTGNVRSLAFSSDGTELISSGQDKTARIWNVSDGRELRLSGHVGAAYSAAFLPDERWAASASEDGSVIIWNRKNGTRLATLLSLRKSEDWIVVQPDGFFDGSPTSWNQISWRFDNKTFSVRPVEEFFSEFWVPGLLDDLLNERKLPAITDISGKDRRQPVLNLTVADMTLSQPLKERKVMVRIEVKEAPAGAKDLRLFRNGVLVKVWRNNVLSDGKSSAVLEWPVSIVAGENRLTAYAFNSFDIKSKDAPMIKVIGAPSLSRKGIMHVLSIGISEYANADYNLNYAKDDATEFADELKRQQDKLNNFEKVEVTTLFDRNATRENIFKWMSAISTNVKPEDAFVVFFAGHGSVDQKRFYLIPHDLGYMGSRATQGNAGFDTMIANSVSDLDLERALETIDAGQMLMVIDACESGQLIETNERGRQGPTNSKGLAQLAYEKGIYILTAAQKSQEALENTRLKHGYLTYALVNNGLIDKAADQDQDGKVLLGEWLEYAKNRVPQIDREEAEKDGRVARILTKSKTAGSGTVSAGDYQRPKVFYGRQGEPRPLVIAGY